MARVLANQLIWHYVARMIARLSACALLLLLGACAAALPGYIPPSTKGKSKFASPYTSGEVNPEGRYEMSEQEKLMDCKRTTGSMLITISYLRHRNPRSEPRAPLLSPARRFGR